MCKQSNSNIATKWSSKCKETKEFSTAKLSFWIRHGKLPGYVWLETTIFPLFKDGKLIGKKEISKWDKPTKVLFTDNPPCILSDCANYQKCQIDTKYELVLNYGP